ncbi:MAG: hypothetical protein IT497_07930 [Ottowia sp.]|nr:hypothetical protein [Ottowia sp.]
MILRNKYSFLRRMHFIFPRKYKYIKIYISGNIAMPNSLTPATSTGVNSVDQTQNNAAINNSGNLADKSSLKSSTQNPAVRAPSIQDTARDITKNQTFPATIESVDTTTLPRADSVTEDTPTEVA